MAITRPRILAIGSANADLVTRVSRCPKPGESLVGHGFATVPGGKGANQAVAAARLGAAVSFVGAVGDDALGTMIRNTLVSSGVNVDQLRTATDAPTGTAVIFVADDGQNSIVVTPAANETLTASDIEVIAPLIAEADVVLLQLEIRLEAVERAMAIARKHNVLTLLDAGPAQAVADELIGLADIISPNETEAEAITGITVDSLPSAEAAAQVILDRGARDVVLKLGASGAYHRSATGASHVAPAFEVTALDTVAAGDAFTAALGMRWRVYEPMDALRYANAAGALATTKPGAQDAMPTAAEVAAMLKEQ